MSSLHHADTLVVPADEERRRRQQFEIQACQPDRLVGLRKRCVRVEPGPLPVAGAAAFQLVESIHVAGVPGCPALRQPV
ncbi:MAG: hypothetical protein ACRDUV_22980 [Pseudonocardiaceae bacterium]